MNETEQAILNLDNAIAIAKEIGDSSGEACASWNLGKVYKKLGKLESAIAAMEVRINFERKIGHPDIKKHEEELQELRTKLTSNTHPKL